MPLDRAVVMTSICFPGEAMRRFAALPDWQLVVVADRKTPADRQQAGARFLSVAQQRRLPFRSVDTRPGNHYARKMTGDLEADAMMAVIRAAVRPGATISDNLHRVYAALVKQEMAGPQEMTLVDAWLEDVAELS